MFMHFVKYLLRSRYDMEMPALWWQLKFITGIVQDITWIMNFSIYTVNSYNFGFVKILLEVHIFYSSQINLLRVDSWTIQVDHVKCELKANVDKGIVLGSTIDITSSDLFFSFAIYTWLFPCWFPPLWPPCSSLWSEWTMCQWRTCNSILRVKKYAKRTRSSMNSSTLNELHKASRYFILTLRSKD